ncbi:MAG: hypothetical protein HY902_04785 [Deltaproteobacteria bacterium]|nr:hypothetical protein [Deltaproteobacteria bacterium]
MGKRGTILGRGWWAAAWLAAGCGVEAPGGAVSNPAWLDAEGGEVAGGGDAGLGSLGRGNDGGAEAGGVDAVSGDAAGGDVVATSSEYYAFWQQARRLAKNPSPFGEAWQETRTTSIGLVKVDWQGSQGAAYSHTCAVTSNPAFSSQLTYPAAFINALAAGPLPLVRAGGEVELQASTTWLGLQSGYAGAMPGVGDGKHAAVVDADSDGKPGATVYIDAPILGQQAIYVVQRNTSAWKAPLQADGSLHPLPSGAMEQVTVGATSSILVAEDVGKPLPGVAPVELHWRPVAANLTCAALVAKAAELTGQAWPP